jgi:CHAT domain-containing protein/tetratricopeptide (TPR) repeat protein
MGSKQSSLSGRFVSVVSRFALALGLTISITMTALVSASGQLPSGVPDRDRQNLELIDSLLHQSYELTQQGKYDEALPLAERALAIARELSTRKDYAFSSCFYQLAIVYQGKSELLRAEDLYKQSISLAEQAANEGMIAAASQGLADLYFKQKANEKARPLYERALSIWEKLGGHDYEGAIAAVHRLAQIALTYGRLDEAEAFIRRAIESTEKTRGMEHVDVARFLTTLVEVLIKKRRYELADKEIERFRRILESSPDLEARSHLAGALSYFSTLCSDQGQYDLAVTLCQQGLEVAEKEGRPRYPDLGMYWLQLAKIYEASGDYERAEASYKSAIQAAEQSRGPSHPDTASEINILAGMYDRKADYDKSEPMYLRTLKIFEQSSGSEQNLAYTLGQLGWLHLQKGEYDKAEPFFQRAVEISQKALGSASPIYAIHLNGLAFLCYRIKDYSRAESLYLRSLAITDKVAGRDQVDSVTALMGLGDVFSARGEYEPAESFHRRALAIREKALGPKHLDVTFPLDSLALLFVAQREYGKAEPLFRRALEIRQDRFGSANIQVVPSLNNLANVYRSIGDYPKAKQLYERALSINEKALGPKHRYVSFSLNSLGSVLLDTGEYETAEKLLKQSLSIAESVGGKENSDISFTLTLLALVYRGTGDFDKAESLNKRALIIDEKAYGSDDTSVATDLHNLALIYTAQQKFAMAEPLFLRALKIEEKAKGANHPELAGTLLSIAYFYGAKGDIPQAVSTLTRGTEISEGTINNILTNSTGTDEQKRAYMAMDEIGFETKGTVALHMQFAPNDSQAARLALTTILRRKGRVLDAVSDSIQILRRHLGPEDSNLLLELASARSRVAVLSLNGQGNTSRDAYQANLSAVQSEADRIESRITSRSAEFRAAIKPVTIEQVQTAIPSDAVLIEIVSYQPFNPRYRTNKEMWGASKYAAYALTHEGVLSCVDLGEARSIDTDVNGLRAALQDPTRTDVKVNARRLYDKLMRPLVGLIGGAHRLLLSTDGELSLIPFGALVDEKGHYLVENFSLTYLTSGRDLLRMQVTASSRQGPLVIGDPQYDAVLSKSPSQGSNTGNRSLGLGLSTSSFRPLPGTGEEARALNTVLKDATLLTGSRATKTALKQVIGPSIVHIATHGFFLADQIQQPGLGRLSRQLVKESGSGQQGPTISNPLLRSGLALAGANNWQSAVDDNGILTALETSGLDLWGTKLVVLSACETGVGEVRVGDGVYGLRRALVIAGAESQVMSLWSVSDTATRDLMIDYYTRLQKGDGRGEALRDAQLSMLKSADRSHPYYWASFIQIGDWRKLEVGGTTPSLQRRKAPNRVKENLLGNQD